MFVLILTVSFVCVLLKVSRMEKKVLASIGEYTRVVQFFDSSKKIYQLWDMYETILRANRQ